MTILAFGTSPTTPTSAWVAGTPLVVTPTPTPPPTARAETPMPNPHPAFDAGVCGLRSWQLPLQAERQFRLALDLAPQEAGLHNSLGLTLARQARLHEAIDVIDRQFRSTPACQRCITIWRRRITHWAGWTRTDRLPGSDYGRSELCAGLYRLGKSVAGYWPIGSRGCGLSTGYRRRSKHDFSLSSLAAVTAAQGDLAAAAATLEQAALHAPVDAAIHYDLGVGRHVWRGGSTQRVDSSNRLSTWRLTATWPPRRVRAELQRLP